MYIIAPKARRSTAAVSLILAVALASLAIAASAAATSAGPDGTDGDVVLGVTNQSDTTTTVSSSPGDAFDGSTQQANGLSGSSTYADGVVGTSHDGNGVSGKNLFYAASGVYGEGQGSADGVVGVGLYDPDQYYAGVGVYAESGQTALQVNGKAGFDHSGIAVVPGNRTSVQVTVPNATQLVVACLQRPVAGLVILAAVQDSPSTFTIYLNKSPGKSLQVAWFMFDGTGGYSGPRADPRRGPRAVSGAPDGPAR